MKKLSCGHQSLGCFLNIRRITDKMKNLFLLLVLMSLPSILSAKDFNNGCGTGWNEPIVPETISLLCVDFGNSCAAHDNCYSKCMEGGENYNKPICELTKEEQTEQRRMVCDNSFLHSMREGCDKCGNTKKALCRGVAALYAMVVRAGGKGAFAGREVDPSYYDFIQSEAANNFDFDAFVEDVNQVQSMERVKLNNNFIIKVEGEQPVAHFKSINQDHMLNLANDNEIRIINSLRYGSVDLSGASNGSSPLGIGDLDLNKIDTERLINIQKFETLSP